MHDLNRKVQDMLTELKSIRKSLNLDSKKEGLLTLESASLKPDFWSNKDNAKRVMTRIGDIKKELEMVKKLEDNLQTLLEVSKTGEEVSIFEKEIEKLSQEISSLKLTTYLSGKYDDKNAIVSIHAGQGGVEAMDWTNMLFRMYLRFCEKRSWNKEILDNVQGEEAGIKTVVFRVTGHYVYGYMKGEAGTHRLVRQSPFNADKLRQTSFSLVEVLPDFEEGDIPEIELKNDDLEWQFFRSSSQGGQNVQKVSTAVRLKHIPTGIVVSSQTERYQEQNRKYALNLLRAKLWALQQENIIKERKVVKGEYRPATWGTQIRSYILHPYKLVKDLRTGVETSDVESVLNGEIDLFIEAQLKGSG